MSIYTKIMGSPFVYQKLRPLCLGFDEKRDFNNIYNQLQIEDGDVIVDVGCGMGNAMHYIMPSNFSAYHGFDTDKRALEEFQKKFSDERIFLYDRIFRGDDSININPSKVCMFGLLHHLNDTDAKLLFKNISRSRNLKRIVSCDVFYGQGFSYILNNLFTKLDRGKFGREMDHFMKLVPNNLKIQNEMIIPIGHFVRYFVMAIGASR
jgi:SAM-dependent methyltransferase